MPLENCPKILLLSLYLNYFRFGLNDKILIISDSGSMNEGESVDEQYCEQVNEDQFRDPEPEGQYLEQDFLEGFEDGKFNSAL